MHCDAKISRVVGLAVAGSDEIYKIMAGIIGIVELAPGYGDEVGIVGYIEIAVTGIIEGALCDKDIVQILLYAYSISLADIIRISNIQVLNNNVAFIIIKADVSHNRRIITYTYYGLVRPNSGTFTGTNVNSA